MSDLQAREGTKEGIDRDTALGLYRTMLSIRHMETTYVRTPKQRETMQGALRAVVMRLR